jgi:hypothetical protein
MVKNPYDPPRETDPPQSSSLKSIDVCRVMVATVVDGGSAILVWGYATIYTLIYGMRYVSYSLDTDYYLIALQILASIPAVVAMTYVAAYAKSPKLASFFAYAVARTAIVMVLAWRFLPYMEIRDYALYFGFLAAVFLAGLGISWFLISIATKNQPFSQGGWCGCDSLIAICKWSD